MYITAETKAMAQSVYDFIIMNPDRHDQNYWVRDTEGGTTNMPVPEENICNTTMCIAGATVFLKDGVVGFNKVARIGNWYETAAPALGLTNDEAELLFQEWNNETALDMLNAVIQGDEDKFYAIKKGM